MPQAKKAPAYQWFVKDWRSSRATMRMSMAERGVYREMLDEQWEERSLPDSPEEVADLIATTDGQRAEVLAAWVVVRRKFVSAEPGRIFNVRLEQARREFKAFKRDKQLAGQARAAKAVRGGDGTFQQTSSSLPADIQQLASSTPASGPAGIQPSSASASSSASSSASAGMRRSSVPPLALGLRFSVWRWMLDECIDALGEHAGSFDLDGFLRELNDRQGVIADSWPWLKHQVIAEARRRGLPMAAAPIEPGKQTSRLMAAVANIHREAQS